ncbi:putative exported protein [Candidatus Burkholderia verschuerenii]|uniref:Putative exported protein n=1 Tax=Candidatus Burkholderia verschuerenii TaxID=242163 RepID=A0A0L0MB50_9BURK|nr:hypothetical protein [Candidatus Burkholderia verschuerenii]KND59194.1 putative exported protein [Candidatus Burkholderia verschuerenii]
MQQRQSRFFRLISATAAASVAVLAISAAQAQPAASAPQAASVVGVGDAAAVNLTAKITKIMADTNSVEVKGPKGNLVVIDVNPSVADVKKLKVGDDVNVAYRSALLMSADKVDPKGVESRVSAEQTQPASNGVVVKTKGVQVVAVIQQIDAKSREVTLSTPKRTVTLQVQPDIQLDKFKVGDSVMATYLAAEAIDVTRNGKLVK